MDAELLVALNEEIAGMARAGLPLDQGLAALAREMGRGRLRQVTAALAQDLQDGLTLPEALQRQAGRVPPFYASLVLAGIRTGRIGEVLATLTTYARAIAGLRMVVVDSLFYPGVVLLLAAVLFGFATFFILPQFEQIYQNFDLVLPAVTRAMLFVGRHPIEAVLAPVGGLLACLLAIRLGLSWTEKGRCRWAQLVYAVPVGGTLVRSARLTGFTELLAILVDHEVPLPEAFRLTGESCSDPIMAAAARHIEHDLSQGQPLGQVLRGRGLVPAWVAWMVALGERRGTLAQSLHQIAATYRRQVEVRAVLLRSVLPPFLIVCTAGVFTAYFAFAVMVPMYRLLESLSK